MEINVGMKQTNNEPCQSGMSQCIKRDKDNKIHQEFVEIEGCSQYLLRKLGVFGCVRVFLACNLVQYEKNNQPRDLFERVKKTVLNETSFVGIYGIFINRVIQGCDTKTSVGVVHCFINGLCF